MEKIKRIKYWFKILKILPKSLYFNIKCFDLKTALKLPIFVSNTTKIGKVYKGTIKFNCPIKRGIINIGFGGTECLPGNPKGYIQIEKNAKIVFNGKASFSTGICLRVEGNITFGENFHCNKYCVISCSNKMSFGNDVLIGWNVNIRDTDGHAIFSSNGEKKETKRIVTIGNHVWICANTDVLRASIADGCVLAWGSKLTKTYDVKNAIIGGFPAKIIENDITWEN